MNNTISELVAHYDPDRAEKCHCGTSDRAFIGLDHGGIPDYGKATVHIVRQTDDSARAHRHGKLQEYYIFMECGEGAGIELNGTVIPVRFGTRVCIPTGTFHRVRGVCTFAVVVMPGHIPSGSDDHFD